MVDVPDDDAELDPEEGEFVNPDEEAEDARFFGGGLSGQQEQIVQILDRDEAQLGTSSSQISMLRKNLARFERTINRNQQLRIKFADDPHK